MKFKFKLDEKSLKDSGECFTRYLAVKVYELGEADISERMLAYNELSGRLYVPAYQPTLFSDLDELKKAINRTKDYFKKKEPFKSKKTEYYIYKADFTPIEIV